MEKNISYLNSRRVARKKPNKMNPEQESSIDEKCFDDECESAMRYESGLEQYRAIMIPAMKRILEAIAKRDPIAYDIFSEVESKIDTIDLAMLDSDYEGSIAISRALKAFEPQEVSATTKMEVWRKHIGETLDGSCPHCGETFNILTFQIQYDLPICKWCKCRYIIENAIVELQI